MTDRENELCWRAFNLNWIPVAIMGSVLLFAVALTRFSIEPLAFGIMMAIGITLAAVAYLHVHVKDNQADPKLVFMLGTVAQVIVVTAIVGPLSYVVAALDWPLQDHALAALDRAMGFDAKTVILFVNDYPTLAGVLGFGYGMIKWPLLAIPIVLAATRRWARLQQFVTALMLALMATIVISIFVPAIGNYQFMGLTPADVPNVNVTAFLLGQHDIPAVRDGSLRYLALLKLAGIVTFPSFHTASAVLYAWAFAPVRFFGPTALVINTLMIASTPVIGGHYLVDVVAGAILAVAAIAAAQWLFARLSRGALPQPHAFGAPAQ
jgi:membrane-associated phospholipid phosphatase